MQINVPFGFIGSCKSSGEKRLLLVLKTGSVLIAGALLVASCASSSSDQQQTSTEVPTTTAAPEPPAATTAPEPPVETTTPEATCVKELEVLAGDDIPEEARAEATRAWEDTCAQYVDQLNQVAQSARQFGADSACVERVLASAMAAPFAFMNAFAAATEGAQEGEATWGQFSECMP